MLARAWMPFAECGQAGNYRALRPGYLRLCLRQRRICHGIVRRRRRVIPYRPFSVFVFLRGVAQVGEVASGVAVQSQGAEFFLDIGGVSSPTVLIGFDHFAIFNGPLGKPAG